MTHIYSRKTTTSIVGARGYSGQELARLLLRHPQTSLTHCFATTAFDLDIFDSANNVTCLTDQDIFSHLTDVVFLATPAEVSRDLAPKIIARGKKVIDLSGAFRLEDSETKKWYGFEHENKTLLAESNYGLVPFCGPITPNTSLIANPGCYATSISLALIPLLKKNLIHKDTLVIDAKSGTTGAGRKASEALLFSEVSENCLPYKVGKHQHLPEIQKAVSMYSGENIDPHFTTHLLPIKRGIISAMYAKTKTSKKEDIDLAYAEAFKNYPFVRWGQDIAKYAKISSVNYTPYTHISFELVDNRLFLFSVIDNLMKGAASQAVENLNRLLDLPIATGL